MGRCALSAPALGMISGKTGHSTGHSTGSPDLLTVGHSNLAADQFLMLLRAHDVTTVVDIRSVPFSRRYPWFSGRTLGERLQSKGIAYLMLGDLLGGRPVDPTLYRDGVADYEAMAATADFKMGIDQLMQLAGRPVLLCAEREPLDCHRCLLVARALAGRGHKTGHILSDGRIETHAATEARLLAWNWPQGQLFEHSPSELADAYRHRAAKVAARLSDRVRPGRTPRSRSHGRVMMPS